MDKNQSAMLEALSDRAEIHDLFVAYYSGLGGGDPSWFGKFFVEGAELDVNGIVVHGEKQITKLYADIKIDKPKLVGTFRMILSNLVIVLKGDTATAQMMWTQTLNDTIKGPPRLIEQGLEFDKLTKKSGKWLITKRVVIANSNLPDMMDETYTPRKAYSMADL